MITKDEARAILSKTDAWFSFNLDNEPNWVNYGPIMAAEITLDGSFTKAELLAILAFHPDE